MNILVYIGLLPCPEAPEESQVEVFTTKAARNEWLQQAMGDCNEEKGLAFVRMLDQAVATNDKQVN